MNKYDKILGEYREEDSGVTDHGALAGLGDDDHTIYTLANGTRAFTGTQTFNENIEMKDNKYIYFDTAKTSGWKYSTAHSGLLWNASSSEIHAVNDFCIFANTLVDNSGNSEPQFSLDTNGVVNLLNTSQGSAGNKYFNIEMTDGLKLSTTGHGAFLLADNLALNDKTFQFPNASGTFIIGEGVGAGQTLIGGTTTTSDLTLQTTSAVGATGADMHFLVGNAGGTEAMTILNSGNVGIGTAAPGVKLDVAGTLQLKPGVSEYRFGDRGFHLTFQSQSSGNYSGLEFFAKDGDGTDNVTFQFWGVGIPSNVTNRERIQIGWDASESEYMLMSEANGTGTLRPIDIYTEGNRGQLYLKSDGNVGIGTTTPDTKLDVNGAITQRELSADPSDPDEGSNVTWQSDGTGSGDDGDIMMKITAGAVTKTVTIVDFSIL